MKPRINTDGDRWLFWAISVCVYLSLSVMGLSVFGSSIPPHKVHVSVAQIEHNPKAQSAQIVIRVFADDLETALSQHAKRRIKIDPATANNDKQLGQTVIAYLRANFQLKTKAGRPVMLSWVGLEWQTDMFWLYVEGKLPNGLEGTQLRNKVFNELFEDQVNIVNGKIDGKQIGLMFDSKDDFKLISTRPPARK
ncbi:MAG: DUF6702 family protein [Acidobacteriota bacterium]